MSDTSRRAVLAGAAGVSAAAVLAACGTDDSGSPAAGGDGATSGTPSGVGATSAPAGSATGSATGGAGGESLGGKSAVPVGGGKVFEAQKVVVTQPAAGVYKAFSAVCPHRGCSVASVADGKINCPCHNSNFSATDGSRLSGPATTGLAPKTVTVDGDTLRLG